ncbi:RNA polymerase sigma-70 factor (ECF subfamily) [Evansella vedderi]|uniref:RNA polymerase sigma factor n=1 Tax=Evansella vedderi TaxID=38282 RepID=A0ABU0A5N5_9BACI|nr:RNA polymerase sigma factor [Evansella vedderi]MDQ0258023.1 RNA polymerase sigma-70 factor (ECF subfamily) [Evansella vedderi]
MKVTEEQERAWIEDALDGNDEAFQKIINAYHTTVERFARQIGVQDQDIQDVTQEVFIKVYRFLYKYSRGKFSTWLYSVTLNVSKDFFRKQKREKVKMMKAIQEGPATFYEDNLDLSEDARVLHDAIQRLDEKYKVPIVLFYFHDASIKEIAVIMNSREATVKTRLKRGKDMLKKGLKEGGSINEPRAL